VSTNRILGLLGFLCGLTGQLREMDMPELIEIFDLSRLSPEPVIFDDAGENFLISG
jgi:hypothetical protein